MTIIPPPAGVNFGFVSGRFALAVADTAQDDDHLPNFVPASGTISFRPSNGRILTSNPPRYIAPQTVVATLNSAGAISDGNGNSGIWLVVGVYTVSFKLAGLTVQSFDVEVTSAHNESTPLDLVLHTPAPIEPNVKFVVNEQVYTETLAARDEVVALLEGLEGGVGAGIDDAAVNTVSTWSSAKIVGDLSVKVPETRTVAGKPLSSNVTLAKADVGLGNVDNTSDAAKPISAAVQTALDAKAASSHTHTTAQVTGLDTALAGKAATSHTHTTSQVTGLDTALAGKAASTHSHAQADVTGLIAALAGKLASSNGTVLDVQYVTAIPTPVVNGTLYLTPKA